MITRVDSSLPKSMGDLELKQNDIQKSKVKKGAAEGKEPETADADDDALETSAPVHVRYLGKNLDLIA